MLPGGTLNADTLRTEPRAITFIKDFFDNDKPVAAICHAPWLLVEARVVKGHRLTSWPSLKTDVRNAGGDWVDEEVVVDHQLVTSRKADERSEVRRVGKEGVSTRRTRVWSDH